MGKCKRLVRAVLLAILFWTPGAAWAEDWDGSESVDWDDPLNWVGDDLPTDGNTVTLDTNEGDPPYSPTIDSSTSATTTNLSSSAIFIGDTAGSNVNLTITGGGSLITGFSPIGDDGAMGSVTVTGSGSQWTNSTVYVGLDGTGVLNVDSGGVVSTDTSSIGFGTLGDGTVTVTGANSQWTITNDLTVGQNSIGDLTVSAGGYVSSLEGILGFNPGGSGTVLITGMDSEWETTDDLTIGRSDSGDVTLGDSGVANVSAGTGTVHLGLLSGGDGTLNIGAAMGDAAVAPGTLSADALTFGVGDGTIVFNHTDTSQTYVFAPDITSGSGTSAIDHYSGFTRLTGDGSAFTGTTTIHGGTLQIEDVLGGGTNAYVGDDPGDDGAVIVTGASAQWTGIDTLFIGNDGTGALTIAAGGSVATGFEGIIGVGSDGIGTVLVTGTDSQWTGPDSIYSGYDGSGSLTIAAGGYVSTELMDIATFNGSDGQTSVTGTGSELDLLAALAVGQSGDGELTISDGGLVKSGEGRIAVSSTSTSNALITGAGSKWEMTNSLNVGYGGTGELTVEDSGTLMTPSVFFGTTAGASGTATVSGTGSNLTVSNVVAVGQSGQGSLSILDGGSVSGASSRIGVNASGSGEATVAGAGSMWSNVNEFTVGSNGTGELTLSSGGVAESDSGTGDVDVALFGGSTGTLNIGAATGDMALAPGTLSAGSLTFGGGTGTLVFNHADGSGTYAFAPDIFSGAGTSAINHYAGFTRLTGNNSGVTGVTTVEGGTLQIENLLNGAGGVIGDSVGSNGAAIVTGAGSQWQITSDLFVGNNGTGALTVSNGGQMDSIDGQIGFVSGSSGAVTVTGAGSVWNVQDIFVGNDGDGAVFVFNGGLVDADQWLVGSNAGADGSVTVSGTGSEAASTDYFSIGENGVGEMTLANLGVANTTGGADTVYIGRLVSGDGTVNIGAAAGNAAAAPGNISTGAIAFGDGTGTLVFNHTNNGGAYAFATDIVSGTGAASIDHYAGYTNLTGDNSGFDGTTTVYGGTLAVENLLGGTVDVMNGGTLGGSGQITGTINVGNGAVLAPGSSIGILNVLGNLVQGAGSTLEIEVDAAGNSDLLNITGSYVINAGATLHATPENGTDNGSTYAEMTTYTVVTATTGVSGAFDTITDDFLFLDAMASYDANNVYLTLERVQDFVEVATTPNQISVAGALDNLADDDPIKLALLMAFSEADAQDAFNQLSGEIHPSMRAALRANDGRNIGVALSRLDDLAEEPASNLWATGTGNWRTTDATINTHELEDESYGLIAGVDGVLGDALRVGLMGAYNHIDASVFDLGSEADADSYAAGLYGGTSEGRFVLDFGALYAWHDVDTTRAITNPLTETLTASYDAHSVHVFGEAGMRFGADRFTATPFAGIAYGNVTTDDFAEQGGDAALSSASESMSTTFATLGVRPQIELASNIQMRGMAGWRRVLGDLDTDNAFSFDGVNRFDVTGAPLAEDSFVGEFGLDVFTTDGLTIGASYVGQHSDGVTSNAFDFRVSTTF